METTGWTLLEFGMTRNSPASLYFHFDAIDCTINALYSILRWEISNLIRSLASSIKGQHCWWVAKAFQNKAIKSSSSSCRYKRLFDWFSIDLSFFFFVRSRVSFYSKAQSQVVFRQLLRLRNLVLQLYHLLGSFGCVIFVCAKCYSIDLLLTYPMAKMTKKWWWTTLCRPIRRRIHLQRACMS